MKVIIFFSLLLIAVTGRSNKASYIKADGRPLNIAHRGLASILPENTMEAFQAALYQGADFIELDVVYTKQKYALVMHDPFLTRITNIKEKPEFATRYEKRLYGNSNKTDWWTDTFTLSQLKTLGIKQAQNPGRISIFDYKFTFPLLEDVVQMCINFNKQFQGKRNPDGRLGGILIEAKDSQMYRDLYGLEIGETILNVLKKYGIETVEKAQKVCPIYLHSFDYGTVKYWADNTELPNNYLLLSSTKFDLNDINKYATGIGFQDSMIYNYSSHQLSNTLEQCQTLGLMVHVWTFKDDNLLFESKSNLDMYEFAQQTMKLDGVITEFSDIYAPISQLLKANADLKQQILNWKTKQIGQIRSEKTKKQQQVQNKVTNFQIEDQ